MSQYIERYSASASPRSGGAQLGDLFDPTTKPLAGQSRAEVVMSEWSWFSSSRSIPSQPGSALRRRWRRPSHDAGPVGVREPPGAQWASPSRARSSARRNTRTSSRISASVCGPRPRTSAPSSLVSSVSRSLSSSNPRNSWEHREFEALAQLVLRAMAWREVAVFEAADRVRR
jgi:hypothetical protein